MEKPINKHETAKEIDIMEYWRIILARKKVLIAFAVALVVLTAIFSFLATPIYKATATLLIEEEGSRIMSIEETFGAQSRIVQDLRFFNTQIKLFKSKSLAEKVARKMNLASRPEFLTRSRRAAAQGGGASASAAQYSLIAREILNDLDVHPLRETKLIELSFESRSPSLSAELVNTLAEEFITYSIERRYETTQQASDFLSEQIASLREDLSAKEQDLQKYGQEKDLFFLTDTTSTTGNKFADLSQAYNQALIARVNAEGAYREIKDLDVESIPQFVNNPVVQQLRTDYMRTKTDYDEKIKKFKPDYPEMVQLRARLESMQKDLRRAVQMAEADYQSALKKEYSLRRLLEQQKVDVAKMNSNAILYNNLKIEVETKRRLFNSLVEKQNETLVSSRLGGLKSSNIGIIDRAEIPRFPISPRKKLNLVLALIIGLFGGAGLCFLLEYLDNTVKGNEEIEKLTGIPSLGIIPHFSPDGQASENGDAAAAGAGGPGARPESNTGIELHNQRFPNDAMAEYFRTIRTSILFSRSDKPPKCIAFTSAMPQEGKTSTVINLAVSFSQLQQKVLLVEADMRRPRISRVFGANSIKGLSSYLTGKVPLKEAIQATGVENLWLLPCGPIPPNPGELLNSDKMKHMLQEACDVFDIVMIDTPPVLAVIDSVVVSAMCDAVVFVVKSGKTGKKALQDAVGELTRYRSKIIGSVLNDVEVRKGEYGYRAYYHPRRPEYAAADEEESL